MLARWTDLAAPRPQAVWLLVPQLPGTQGAVVDGRPSPLAAPGQLLRMDTEWFTLPLAPAGGLAGAADDTAASAGAIPNGAVP